ncbi:O-antigen ligase family protein [Paenibacillus lemnae]|nr:O-antigen ligase family protein [Paenibacillus lemnae]
MKLLEMVYLLVSTLLGFLVLSRSPGSLIPYTLVIWTISPEVRRIIDWSFLSFSDFSLIMISPHCVSLILLIPVLNNYKFLDHKIKIILRVMIAALTYGCILGFMKYGLSTVFELLNLAIPFLVLVYVGVTPFKDEIRDKWMRSFTCLAVVVGFYGIYQYLVLPPWDGFWIMNSGMRSVGQPEAQQFRVFSFLNSPGPAGMFLGIALAVMIVQKKWRAFGLIGVMTVAFALMLTLVRVGWICCLVMFIAYFSRSQLVGKLKLFTVAAILVLFYFILLPLLPGSDEITSRFNTFESLEDDHSFNERLDFAKYIISDVMKNPIGNGIGSSGIGVKLTQNTNTLAVFDNGYLNLLYLYGLPLGVAVIIILLLLFVFLLKRSRVEKRYTPLSFAAISALFFLMLSSNVMAGLSGYILLLLISLSYSRNSERS